MTNKDDFSEVAKAIMSDDFKLAIYEKLHEMKVLSKTERVEQALRSTAEEYEKMGYERGRKCEVCGGTDVICAKGWKDEREKLQSDLAESQALNTDQAKKIAELVKENARLKELVDKVVNILATVGHKDGKVNYDGVNKALSKIAEFKEGRK